MKNDAHAGLRLALLASAPMLIAACANLNTIDRRTMLPGDKSGKAIAVHLDAKQRLVISHSTGIYCAEPSPDALSAASSGQGASASVAGKGSGAVSLAAEESAASIGLRTQSIQLQREIFYRLCEAYYNGGITQVQLATLFARSQNLTAVVLAVEQLTGAVAANQVILTGSGGSTSFASLVSDQKALEAARESEGKAKARLDAAQKAKDDQDVELALAEQQVTSAEKALAMEKAKETPDAAEVGRLEAAIAARTTERGPAAKKAEDLGRDLEQAKLNHGDAAALRGKIEASLDSATAGAAANATGSGAFTVVAPRRELSAEATREIAAAVEKMVSKALETDDTVPTCLGVLAWAAQEEQVYNEARQQIEQLRGEPSGVKKISAPSVQVLQSVVDNLNTDQRVQSRNTARTVCLEIITKHLALKKPT